MAAPPKPWERVGVNFQNNGTSSPSNSMAGCPIGGGDNVSSVINGAAASPVLTSPPQLPPRPSQQSSYGSRFGGGYGTGYNTFGSSFGGGYSSFSNPYSYGGGYGGMYSSPYSTYGGYGSHNMSQSSFARHAEESSRPAFESIESIVHAVSSVGMMLDSTFSAVYNSFRAVIGVADNFARLKSQLIQVFSALAFIRTLRYMIRKLLEILRLTPKGEAEKEWRKAFNSAAAASSSPDNFPKRSSWPILMFFGIIMGGPYLIWKLISKFSGEVENGWASGKQDHFLAKANFSFQGQGSEELSFSAGHELRIAPKELQPQVRGWLLASVDGSSVGLIPANYVTILGKRRGLQPDVVPQIQTPQATASSPSQPISSSLPLSSYSQPLESVSNSNKDFESCYSNDYNGPSKPEDIQLQNQEAADILDKIEK